MSGTALNQTGMPSTSVMYVPVCPVAAGRLRSSEDQARPVGQRVLQHLHLHRFEIRLSDEAPRVRRGTARTARRRTRPRTAVRERGVEPASRHARTSRSLGVVRHSCSLPGARWANVGQTPGRLGREFGSPRTPERHRLAWSRSVDREFGAVVAAVLGARSTRSARFLHDARATEVWAIGVSSSSRVTAPTDRPRLTQAEEGMPPRRECGCSATGVEEGPHGPQVLAAESVVGPSSALFPQQEAGIDELLEVVRQRRLRDAEGCG